MLGLRAHKVMLALLVGLATAGVSTAGPLEDAVGLVHSRQTEKGMQQLRALAESGDVKAQMALAENYWRPLPNTIPRDVPEAIKWYRKAGDGGNNAALYHLAWAYEKGDSVPQSYGAAAKYYRILAERGKARGQDSLGLLYYNGEGVAKDNVEAVKWFRKAAEQDNVLAMYNLGMMYAQAKGVTNVPEAAKWMLKAAERDMILAKEAIGGAYANGAGVPRDLVEGYKWLSLAAKELAEDRQPADAIRAAEFRDKVMAVMTPEQLAEANKRIKAWKPVK